MTLIHIVIDNYAYNNNNTKLVTFQIELFQTVTCNIMKCYSQKLHCQGEGQLVVMTPV